MSARSFDNEPCTTSNGCGKGNPPMNARSLILDSVHAVETALETDSEIVCESPLCSTRFPQTGLQMEPRRFCSEKCRQQTSILRRAAALLVPLGKDKAWEALSE